MQNLNEIPRGFHEDIGLDDLRRHVLLVSVIVCVCASFVVMFSFAHPSGTEDWVTTAVLALYGVTITILIASRWSTMVGGASLICGLIALASGSLWIAPLHWVVGLAPLVVPFAIIFFGFPGGIFAAVVVTADLFTARALGGPFTGEGFTAIIALTWAYLPVAWLASEPIRLALRWSWTEYCRAEGEADRARRQQAELVRVVKSLNLAQDRLEKMNVEMERARRAAEEARRLKTEFASTISHELRTPLNMILGLSELMAVGMDSTQTNSDIATFQGDIDTIYRNARHLSSLIDDILDLAQIDAARMGLARASVMFDALVREAAAVVEPLFTRKGLYLRVNVQPDLAPVSIDRARIRQVLINLLSNAARFTDAGGVQVSATLDGQHVLVTVSDTGLGIPEEELTCVFEEFRQVGAPGDHHTGHSGLGLTISKRIVELHGGSMWVESIPGQGSSFRFTLPLCDNVASVPLRQEWETWARPVGRDATYPTIIVYDDDREPAHLLQRYLDGYDVLHADSIVKVRRLRQDHAICAVVLTGPTESAMWRSAQQLRSHISDLPILLCPLPGRRHLAAELGVRDYLVKPILRDQIARLLCKSRPSIHDVLVIDDDPDLVDLLTRMIASTSRRTKVRAAYGGAEGLAALRERRPDLVLLDLLMPQVDGYTVLEEIRADESLRDVPVVVLTARGEQEEVITTGMLGITRGSALTVAELVRLLKVSIDTLNATSSDREQPADLPG